jgi:HlyD family secretion protein
MKKLLPILIILVAVGAGGAVFYAKRDAKEPTVNTLPISRGTIVDGVRATGTLQAVTTVTVGTQVSGIVQDLPTDFNDIVKKGQVIARLDPSILETQVETAKANLVNAQANLERQRVTVDDARQKLKRARELNDRQLTTKVDLENAELTVKTAEAQLKSTESSIVQAEAAVNKAQVDLGHTVIKAPIDGIVIKRSVDKGQTVNAGMSAPELFIIAADLTKMQVNANIDETDVGRMRPGQAVTFTVDAYPTDNFHGTVKQVRLNPTTVQNVVTYSTVIDVPNPELKLKPGMTASVTIEIARRENALRVPSAAIRFRPTADIFAALHQTVPPELERGFGRGNRGDRQTAGGRAGAGGPSGGPAPSAAPGQPGAPAGAPSATAPATGQPQAKAQSQSKGPRPQGQQQAGTSGAQPTDGQGGQGEGRRFGGGGQGGPGGGGFGMTPEERERFRNMSPEERQKAMEERMKNMTPEQRAAMEERRRQREANGGGRGGEGGGNFGGGNVGGRGGGQGGNFQRNSSAGSGQGGRGNAGGGNATVNRGGGAPQNTDSTKSAATTSATTIDALFAPLQPVETRGRVWLYINKQLKPVELRLGITDGTYTEVLNDPTELAQNTEVVISVITPEMASRPAGQQQNQGNNPLMPQRGRGPGGPGGGGGRGGGR